MWPTLNVPIQGAHRPFHLMEPLKLAGEMASPRSATITAWEETLAPWLRVLETAQIHGFESMPHTMDGRSEIWWGVSTSFVAARRRWTMVGEAMELLELLARVEPQVAHILLAQIAGLSHPDAAMQLPRFELRVEDDWEDLEPETREGILHLLTHDGRKSSLRYESVKASLLAQWTVKNDGRVFDRAIDGRVEVAFEFTMALDDRQREAMDALHTLASTHAGTSSGGPFVLHSLQIRFVRVDERPMTDYVLQRLNEIAAMGVPVTHFYFVALLHSELNPALLGTFMLRQFVPAHRARGVHDLELSASSFDAAAVQSFCTAIARSPSLRNVDFEICDDFTDGDQATLWWPWLAYALFSRHSDHRINAVRLNLSSLTMNHIRVIREMMSHDNPLALLYQSTPTGAFMDRSAESHEIYMAMLRESTTAVLGLHPTLPGATMREDTERTRIRLSQPMVPCQIVRDRIDEDFVQVILPGSGVCSVDRSGVMEIVPSVLRSAHPIRKLTISEVRLDGDSAQPSIEFLKVVGGPLQHLEVCHGSLVDDNFCNSALAACPNLTSLGLFWLGLESLEWLVNTPSMCKLRTLKLSLGHNIIEGVASWLRFFSVLSDPSHPLTQSLRDLHIDVRQITPNELIPSQEDAICEGFVAMLDTNHLLQYCTLVSGSEETSARYKTRLEAHHNEPLCEEESPLPLRQRLAFASVISASQEELPPPSLQKHRKEVHDSAPAAGLPAALSAKLMSPEIVGLVFAFAAESKRRVCRMGR